MLYVPSPIALHDRANASKQGDKLETCNWYAYNCCNETTLNYVVSFLQTLSSPPNCGVTVSQPCLHILNTLACSPCSARATVASIQSGSFAICDTFADKIYEACKSDPVLVGRECAAKASGALFAHARARVCKTRPNLWLFYRLVSEQSSVLRVPSDYCQVIPRNATSPISL